MVLFYVYFYSRIGVDIFALTAGTTREEGDR